MRYNQSCGPKRRSEARLGSRGRPTSGEWCNAWGVGEFLEKCGNPWRIRKCLENGVNPWDSGEHLGSGGTSGGNGGTPRRTETAILEVSSTYTAYNTIQYNTLKCDTIKVVVPREEVKHAWEVGVGLRLGSGATPGEWENSWKSVEIPGELGNAWRMVLIPGIVGNTWGVGELLEICVCFKTVA